MNKFNEWFKDLANKHPAIQVNKELAEDAWNAAIDEAMEAALSAAHPNDWLIVGKALQDLKT